MTLHKQYTDLQLFTMAYLASEEQNQEEQGLAYGHESTFGMPVSHRYTTSISELSLKLPPYVIPSKPSGNEILSDIEKQIRELESEGLLKEDSQLSSDRESQDRAFYITASGRLFIRKHYTGLIPLVENKKVYQRIVNQLQVDPNSKKYLEKLRDKLTGKTEDKIIDTLISETVAKGKEYGPILLRFMTQLLHEAAQP